MFYGVCKEQTQKKFHTKFSSNSHVHGSLLIADGFLRVTFTARWRCFFQLSGFQAHLQRAISGAESNFDLKVKSQCVNYCRHLKKIVFRCFCMSLIGQTGPKWSDRSKERERNSSCPDFYWKLTSTNYEPTSSPSSDPYPPCHRSQTKEMTYPLYGGMQRLPHMVRQQTKPLKQPYCPGAGYGEHKSATPQPPVLMPGA